MAKRDKNRSYQDWEDDWRPIDEDKEKKERQKQRRKDRNKKYQIVEEMDDDE